MDRTVRTLSLAVALGVVLIGSASASSFDCLHPPAPLEAMICNDPQLSKEDDDLDRVFKAVLTKVSPEAATTIRDNQRVWFEAMRVEALSHDPTPSPTFNWYDVRSFYQLRFDAFTDMLRKRGPFVFYMVDKELGLRDPPAGRAFQALDTIVSFPQIDRPTSAAQRAWNRMVAIPLDAFPSCGGKPSSFYRTINVYWASPELIYMEDSSGQTCGKDGTPGKGRSISRTYVLDPAPHLMRTDDLFLAGSEWRTTLARAAVSDLHSGDWTWRMLVQELGSSARIRGWVEKAALQPERWMFLSDGIHIGLDRARGDFAVHGHDDDPRVRVTWDDLRSVLKPGMVPPSQAPDASCCNVWGETAGEWR